MIKVTLMMITVTDNSDDSSPVTKYLCTSVAKSSIVESNKCTILQKWQWNSNHYYIQNKVLTEEYLEVNIQHRFSMTNVVV